MISVEEFLRQHNARVDKDKTIYLECLCDGTLIFQVRLVKFLKMLRCTDIKSAGWRRPDLAPEDKPWCSWLYEASGVLPKDVIFHEGSLYRFIEEREKGYEVSELRKWLEEQGFPNKAPLVQALTNPNDMLFVPSLSEGQYIDTGVQPQSLWLRTPDSIKSKTIDLSPIERERNYLGKWNLPKEDE